MPYPKVKTESYRNLNGINSKVSPYQLSQEEFFDLSNVNFVTPASLTKRPGTTIYIGATISGKITGVYEYQKLSGASFLIVTGNTQIYTANGGFSAIGASQIPDTIFDFVTFVDYLFLCNGNSFQKFNGSAISFFGLPTPANIPGITFIGAPGSGDTRNYNMDYGYGYINDRGFYSIPSLAFDGALYNGQSHSVALLYGMTTPSGYGISAIVAWISASNRTDLNQRYALYLLPAGATSATFLIPSDSAIQASSPYEGDLDYFGFTAIPKYLEIYNNQLFMAGFSSLPSTVYWSEIGEPEAIDPTFSTEVRTNDGDRVTALKVYSGSILIAKEKSIHRITGDNPSNFLLTEISDQYGCLSNKAIVVYDDTCLFLDQKGIVKYNGSNIQICSNRVEPIFARMNVAAARENACAIHFKEYNEIWFSVPVDGSTKNNVTIVYDYLANGWTKYNGLDISALAIVQGRLSKRSVVYGGYTGGIFDFNAAYFGDNGNGISCLIGSRFIAPMGQSVEEIYRRLYLDVDPITGITQPITVEMKTNYGATIQLTRTMYQNPFQSRIDFGLSARSLAVNFNHYSASLPFKVNGWTIESRFQRNV